MTGRSGSVVRGYLVLLALFGLAFGSVLLWTTLQSTAREHTRSQAHASGNMPSPRRSPDTAARAPGDGTTVGQAVQTRDDDVGRSPDDSAEGSQDGSPDVPPEMTPELLADSAATDGMTNSSASANTLAVSADTLADTLRALTQTVSADPDAQRRARAITELTDLAHALVAHGQEIGIVRDTLRLAAADDDENVAERAKDAYDDLMQRLD